MNTSFIFPFSSGGNYFNLGPLCSRRRSTWTRRATVGSASTSSSHAVFPSSSPPSSSLSTSSRSETRFRMLDPSSASSQTKVRYETRYCMRPKVEPVWPDWGDLLDFGKFLKPLATLNLPKSPTFLGIFVKVSKSIIFLVKQFLGDFYRHLAIFFWSLWAEHT